MHTVWAALARPHKERCLNLPVPDKREKKRDGRAKGKYLLPVNQGLAERKQSAPQRQRGGRVEGMEVDIALNIGASR